MKDLGETYEKSTIMVEPAPESKPKKTYPKLCLRDKSLEAVIGKTMPSVGTEMEGEIVLKVSGISNDEYGKRVDFDVVSLELGEAEDSEEEDGEEETA